MNNKELVIGSKLIGKDVIFFNIEEGMANLGSFPKAIEMIDAVASTGADSIEFQLVIASDFYVPNHPGFEFCSKVEFSDSQIIDLVAYAKSKGLEFIGTPLSHRLVETLVKAGSSGININASDLTNPQMIDAVVESGLPFFLSIPLATEKEIDWAINRVHQKSSPNFMIQHGQHTMFSGEKGIEITQTTLGFLSVLKAKYNVPVGFIDHTPFAWMPAAAVAAGADLISKHLALSRADQGPDWQICLEPKEMMDAVDWAKKMKDSINIKDKKLAVGEDLDREKMRRSIVAAKMLKAGSIITLQDIAFKRPGTGIEPLRYLEVIGKKILRDVLENGQIKTENLE